MVYIEMNSDILSDKKRGDNRLKVDLNEMGWTGQLLHTSSLADKTAQLILDAIVEGRLRPDQPFPSQYQLCESFGVSRTVVREATQILVSKGILDVKHGKRITIRPATHEQISQSLALTFRRRGVTPLDVLELRKAIEVEAAGMAAERATEEDIAIMEETISRMSGNLDSEKGYVEADVDFHSALFAAAKQPAFELLLVSLNEFLIESRKRSYRGRGPTERALHAHRHILDAILGRDVEAAKQEMRRHLEETESDLKREEAGESDDRSWNR